MTEEELESKSDGQKKEKRTRKEKTAVVSSKIVFVRTRYLV